MDRPKMPESPLIVSHWEGPDSKSYTVYTEANMQAYGDQCVEFGMASVGVTESILDRLETITHELEDWTKAYPLDIFPEPTKAQMEWLRINKPGLPDRIAASMGRHMVKHMAKMAEEVKALTAALGGGE